MSDLLVAVVLLLLISFLLRVRLGLFPKPSPFSLFIAIDTIIASCRMPRG
jgi:hypothetical protein